ncbi:zinc finger MYM-type protein 5-like [Papaver somniferum]|uniref:zinc finger MYM-type protein 5-like n=1 Tax=Papaver somniferum TaxID=3469 RepID=UPI000E700ACB|nr:zinc finger MYM-type protein 5-like [Papaver somniferum]
MIRKQKSGHAKAVIRQRRDAVERSQTGDMNKYLVPRIIQHTETVSDEDETNDIDNDEEYENLVNNMLEEDALLNGRVNDENVQEELSDQELNTGEDDLEENIQDDLEEVQNRDFGPVNIHDPGNWKEINHYLRNLLVEHGHVRRNNTDFVFPKGAGAKVRRFEHHHYIRQMSNGETEDRRWLVYSNVLDRVFCFCFKLFKQGGRNYQLDTNGSRDWHNMGAKLSRHELSTRHYTAMHKWKELEIRLHKNETIDKEIHERIKREKEYWKQVLIRIVVVIRTLAKNNLAFRGANDKVGVANNGNFLSFIEMITKFDLVMQEHLRRIKDHEVYHHYLGPSIQNELIALLARHVKD